jgi:hypothetical protein
MHWCAPKIVEEHTFYRRVGPQITIFFDSAYVIEHEATVETVVVAQHARKGYDGPVQMFRRHDYGAGRTYSNLFFFFNTFQL